MVDDRNHAVHDSGSTRAVAEERISLPPGTYRTPDGLISSDDLSGVPPVTVHRPSLSFNIDGAELRATAACAAYLDLLQRMVAQFEAEHGQARVARRRAAR